MDRSKKDDQLRIAIIGGGLAGATLVNALMRNSHLDIQIYESASEFSERGAAVGLAANAQRALSEIGPEIRDALDAAGAVAMHSARNVMGIGPDTGTTIFELGTEHQGRVVHRAAFLKALLKPVPREIMHTSKKLVKIDVSEDRGVTIFFEDGTEEHADAVIGADGIHGRVREHILGSDHPALKPTFAGFWSCGTLVPMAKAREVLGQEYFAEPRQFAWSNNGGFLMHDVLDNQERVQCLAAVMTDENWDESEWKRKVDRETLEDTFSRSQDSHHTKGMIELLSGDPELCAMAQWHHGIHAPTFTKGRVCIMGDAAHAMTPWQGAGAGQAIEDAMILGTLLQETKSINRLSAAFRAYDELICGRGPGIDLDVERLREALPPRWKFIHELDMKEHKEAALTAMSLDKE